MHGRGWWGSRPPWLAVAICVGLSGISATPSLATTSTSDDAASYLENAAHSGALENATLLPPLARKWSRDLGRRVSFPLIAEDKIFVAVRVGDSYGADVLALDAATGRTLWSRSMGGVYWRAGTAYENGRLFVITEDADGGVVRALSSQTGEVVWERHLTDQWSFEAPPTASDGFLYTGGAGDEGTLWALKQSTGATVWKHASCCGLSEQSPAVDASRVYVSDSCPNIEAFKRSDGSLDYRYEAHCDIGGEATAAQYKDRVYARSSGFGQVFDRGTGNLLGTLSGGPPPTFASGVGLYAEGEALRAVDVDTGSARWSFTADSTLSYAPVVVGQVVYVASFAGTLYALDLASGEVAWSGAVGQSLDNGDYNGPFQALGAGEQTVAVPAGGRLVAFGPAPQVVGEPDTTITAQPPPETQDRTASFEFRSTDPLATFQCRLDAGDWSSCRSPVTYTDLGTGQHTFQVRAVSLTGKSDSTPASVGWTVLGDSPPASSAPDTTITSQPPAKTTSKSATFGFESDTGTSFECKLDSGSWGSCSSPKTYSKVSAGSHKFSVRAIDAEGNVDPTPATATWKRKS